MILTMFGHAIMIQLTELQSTQKAYQKKDMDPIDTLKFFLLIFF